MAVTMLARLLRDLVASIEAYDKQIGQLMTQHPDARIFTSLPGAADAMAPRLLVAFGADRQRMDRAEEMQNFSGIAPVTKRSGKRTSVHRRWACPKFLRQTFHEFAGYSLKKSAWATAYYELQRKQGKGHHTAVRALAFKWIRIIFRCWKTHTPYDETTYLEALRRRGSPLVDQLLPAASGQSG